MRVGRGAALAGWRGGPAACAIAVLASPSMARAQGGGHSDYERATIDEALVVHRAELDPNPEGKLIEAVVVRPLDVFEPRDPLPEFFQDFLNFFHATSRPFTVERELLLGVGDRWNTELVHESERNLRAIRQVSVVLAVPLKGSRPDRVRLLVITKDIWSLRLNSDFRFTERGLERLLLAPSEENLVGVHQSASLRFEYDPGSLTFGTSYKVPRIGGSRLQFFALANVIGGIESGEVEGTSGLLSYGQPLWSTEAEWQALTTLTWQREITRFWSGLEQVTYDAPVTDEVEAIPIEYATDELAARFSFIRSFGRGIKHDVLFGAEASRRAYRARDLSRFDRAAAEEFERTQIPLSDTRIYPYVGYASYSTDFASFLDLNTLGLQEDYRVGHDLYVESYPVLEAVGSTRSFLGTAVGAAYTAKVGDALGRLYADAIVEAAPEQVYDASVSGGLRLVSPRFALGRLVFDGLFVDRFENSLKRKSSIGGDTRMRGYPSGAYRGEAVAAFNVELRTRPLELWTIQTGAVAFYDSGAAFDHGDAPDFKQSAGAGLRVVLPQLDRSVIRLDWAVPLETDPSVGVDSILPGRFIVTFKQAFGMPSIAPPSVTD